MDNDPTVNFQRAAEAFWNAWEKVAEIRARRDAGLSRPPEQPNKT